MSLDDDPGKPSQRERRLERETKRLRYELEVFGRQTPMLRAMIEGAPDALALVSLDGEVFEHNRAFSQLAGADVPCNGRTVAACLAVGFDAVMCKPVTMAQLRKLLGE